MLPHANKLQFQEFTLDREERKLFRSGEPVRLTPKAFDLLVLLVDNRGKVLDKQELLSTLWNDAFVEEGNVAFTIRMIRKALGDDPTDPKFIETIPRRGYRFIATVIDDSNTVEPASTVRSPAKAGRLQQYQFVRPALAIFLVALSLVLISMYGWPTSEAVDNSIGVLSSPFRSERLSTEGNVGHAVISSDGKFVVYVEGMTHERQSIRVRDAASGQTNEILSPIDQWYIGLALSPDDNTIYFVRKQSVESTESCLYSVPTAGGVPNRITCGMQGWIDVSPDGRRVSFVRCGLSNDVNCALIEIDGHGSAERQLASIPYPKRISANAYSPDGRTIAFAFGQSRDGSDDFALGIVDLTTGKELPAPEEKFFNISGISWLPDNRTVLLTAKKSYDETSYFWIVDVLNGKAEPMKRDNESYVGVSLDRNAASIVSSVSNPDFNLYVGHLDDISPLRKFGRGITPYFTSDGRLLYASDKAGQTGIWISNLDGSQNRQLSVGALDVSPLLSPDKKTIYFSSTRSGKRALWEMNSDGSDPREIKTGEGGWPKAVSSDGRWIYYLSGLKREVRRISRDGTTDEVILEKPTEIVELSRDAKYLASFDPTSSIAEITIASLPDLDKIGSLSIPEGQYELEKIVWSVDNTEVFVVLYDIKFGKSSIWRQKIGASEMRKFRDLDFGRLGERSGFAVSHDDRNFAVVHGSWKHDVILIRGLN